jgi:alpha-L-rhamnosidase
VLIPARIITSTCCSTARPSPPPIPRLTVSGGKGAKIRLTYSEALYDKDQHKGDRDEVVHRQGERASPRHHRQLSARRRRAPRPLSRSGGAPGAISTSTLKPAAEPLTLESLTANFTAYPFEERASFHSGDADLDKIWEISWRTARLDAHETYMDTPYYEQLQYVGDTRIQALISYAVAGDDRLARQALKAFDHSRIPDGITRSRYPSSCRRTFPPSRCSGSAWSTTTGCTGPIPSPRVPALPGTRTVLDWFAATSTRRPAAQDSLVELRRLGPSGEIPTYDAQGRVLRHHARIPGRARRCRRPRNRPGRSALARRYQERAARVRTGIYDKCWSAQRGLIADNPDQKSSASRPTSSPSSTTSFPKTASRSVLRQMLAIEPGTTPNGVLSASYYFRFYLARALDHADMATNTWARSIPGASCCRLHFSTWPEIPGDTRSDSHAWTAHPIYDLLTLVAGIEPASPGFATVRIAPHLGNLPSLKATYPHPKGTIGYRYSCLSPS